MNEMHKIDALPALIIGRRDDNGVKTIYFDCSPWAEIYPALSEYRLEMSINSAKFAPLRQSYDNGVLIWTVSEQDTAVAGTGRYEITATGDDGRRKTSASATVYVDERIPGTALGVPPDYVAPLLDRIAEIVAGAGGENVGPEQIQQAVDSYLAENPVKVDEQDPTVPDWAKQPRKPTYTAQEVGALPANAEIVDNTARQGVDENAEAISQLSEEIEELKGGAKKDPVTYTATLEGYLKKDGTVVTTTSYTYHTDYIPLDGYTRIVAKAKITSNGWALAFFNSERVLDPSVSVAGDGASTQTNIDMAVPVGVAYCVLSHYAGENNVNPGYITLYPADAAETDDPLFGKTINVLGDSITSTMYVRPTWWEMIAEMTGSEFNNHGVSGTSIAVREGRTDSFVERAEAMQTDADAVIVMGGTNDAATPRGEWNSTDNTTFFGALNNLIVLLCDMFQGKLVIICTPIQTAIDFSNNVYNPAETLMEKSDTDTLTMQERAAAIRLKCEQYGMHCLDLYNGSGIGGADSGNVYYREGDTLHPSKAGQKRLANLMRREMERFFGIE